MVLVLLILPLPRRERGNIARARVPLELFVGIVRRGSLCVPAAMSRRQRAELLFCRSPQLEVALMRVADRSKLRVLVPVGRLEVDLLLQPHGSPQLDHRLVVLVPRVHPRVE